MKKFDMVAFDCDGVLVDSEPVTCGVLAAMLCELGWQITLEETIHTFVGRLVRDEIPLIEQRTGRPAPADFYQQFVARRDAALREAIEPVRHVADAIARLDAAGMRFCVASGADRAKMQLTLGKTGLLPWFDGKMFSGLEVPRSKPAPDVYLEAARVMGVAPARCLVIEDTPTGIRAGRDAGMTVYGYAERMDAQLLLEAGAERVFDDMAQLPALALA
ncbi:HAD family hydrolase [Noviherbaspirillum aridicola]|uniref:Haloacid dehalogenase n=1 Tax=Noviherbaspirillum aridicola TaxID=2849687 RepID=A0ABQ4Q474_9BURK|nr:HAD family hydrolase [Noviherbaspirillum aridicola]GIZ51802.1 haloacid dehalogenase [Noviherbaspirillum aridicola]